MSSLSFFLGMLVEFVIASIILTYIFNKSYQKMLDSLSREKRQEKEND